MSTKPFEMKHDETNRGFALLTFRDLYGLPCSVQESSLASVDALWLGIDDPRPEIMASKAAMHGVVTDQQNGWVPYPVPDDVLMHTRMHLSREQAAVLINVLQAFVDTGYLPEPKAAGAQEPKEEKT